MLVTIFGLLVPQLEAQKTKPDKTDEKNIQRLKKT